MRIFPEEKNAYVRAAQKFKKENETEGKFGVTEWASRILNAAAKEELNDIDGNDKLPLWKPGEPPKDGELYCGIGQVVYSEEWGGGSSPFISYVKWAIRDKLWIDANNIAIADGPGDNVRIFNWSAIPHNTQ